jgi:phage head maturation protease
MKIYLPIAKVDAERREVWGYASTEARDDQGEIVKRDALVAALGDYMRFANIREMHQLSAVGVAREAAVDDRGLYIGAKIVDDQAWQKVIEGVYKGYSIGGRITQRDPADYKTITGLVLNEISLVDRPANPEAVFDYWKGAGASTMPEPRFNPPIQIWACGVSEHRHLAKADALKCQGEGVVAEVARSGKIAESGVTLIAAAQTAISTAKGRSRRHRARRPQAPRSAQPNMPIRVIRPTERNATRSTRKGTFGPPGTLSTVQTMRGGTPQFRSTTSRPNSLPPGKQRSTRTVRLSPTAATRPMARTRPTTALGAIASAETVLCTFLSRPLSFWSAKEGLPWRKQPSVRSREARPVRRCPMASDRPQTRVRGRAYTAAPSVAAIVDANIKAIRTATSSFRPKPPAIS